MKVILNKCYGGFDVSDAAYELYAKKKGITLYEYKELRNLDLERVYSFDRPLITHYFTEDMGAYVSSDKVDWSKMLYLNSGHRDDETLIEVVEELGKKASGACGKLVVVEIPDGMDYVIDEYDGIETLHHRVQEW